MKRLIPGVPDIPDSIINKSRMLNAIYSVHSKPVVFLPNYGEFGGVIDKLIKVVHFTDAEKIVCCKPGEEAYYPSASKFYYDWNYELIDDIHRWGFFSKRKLSYTSGTKIHNDKYRYYQKEAGNDIGKIKEILGDCEYIPLWDYNIPDWEWTINYSHYFRFELNPIKSNNLYADVIISPRLKKARPDNNFLDWDKFVIEIKQAGYSVGLIGDKATSFMVPESKHASWECEDNASACIELLKNCKLFVGLDTGTGHLASFMNVPMIIFQGNIPRHSSAWIMRKMTKSPFVNLGHGVKLDEVISNSLSFLSNKKFTSVDKVQK